MKDQELFGQLHKLSKMKPDAEWKSRQRSIMLNQLNMSSAETKPKSLFWELGRLPLSFMNNFSEPLGVAVVVVFVFLTGGFVSLRAAQDTKPGDSLYAAKIIGEKTQFALTFSEKGKAQLGLEFAVKRAAEIKQVMVTDEDNEAKDEKVEKLVNDFKKELDSAKSRIAKISESKTENISNSTLIVNEAKDENPASLEVEIKDNDEEVDGVKPGEKIFSAGSEKEDKGLSVSPVAPLKNPETEKATPTPTSTASKTVEIIPTPKSPETILEQASALLKADNYEGAVSVLEEVGQAIDQSYNQGEVKGAEEVKEEAVEEIGTSSESN